jgi:hypothetical protein
MNARGGLRHASAASYHSRSGGSKAETDESAGESATCDDWRWFTAGAAFARLAAWRDDSLFPGAKTYPVAQWLSRGLARPVAQAEHGPTQ